MTEEDDEIDYTTPRNESEVYQRKSPEDYGNDIAKFCFSEFHFIQHIKEVIHDMNLFIRTGHHYVYKHVKDKKNEGTKV
jgi:hypothetical protein